MMEEIARVVSYQDGWAQVEVEVKSACNHCNSQESCGTSAVAKAFSRKTQQFSLPCSEPCSAGDLLRIGLPESVILKAAALIYLMPIIGFLLIGSIANMVLPVLGLVHELFVALLAVTSGYLSWRYAKKRAAQLEKDATPIVIANLGREMSLQRG
ncbi:SoxR reducing system RseC family protein [Shewanella gelidii]|nr:SoxR reducing system RseC family protein [Shewanella gelidii]MCL1096671.1 SoxR reducing system RseC family protein [Shewanella gelidii]